ncbi:MAG: hypothetical protein HQ591_01165 [candidate division Zixibacteria bacterium]|nr:hypothetical protein [Candidatus Tariuqbacter arcticus]
MSIPKRWLSFIIILGVFAAAFSQISKSPSFKRVYFDYQSRIELTVTLKQTGAPIPADKPTGDFFPVGFCAVSNPADFQHFRGTHLNVIHTYQLNWVKDENYIKNFLDEVHRAGLKVTFDPAVRYTKKSEKGSLKLAKARIDMFKDHPALLAWYLADEPFNTDMPLKNIKKIHKYIKKVDPDHPTWLVEAHPKWRREEYYPRLRGITDIMCVETYLKSKFPISYIGEYIAAVRDYCPGQPIWMVAEAFAEDVVSSFPSAEEIRAQTYEGLIDGASAMLYFGFKRGEKPYHQILNYPRQWNEIKRLAEEIYNLKGAWQSPSIPLGELPEEINIALKQYGDWYMLAALNREQRLLSLNLKTEGDFLRGYTFRDYYSKVEDFRFEGELNWDFKPFEVKIFWLIPG